MIINGKMINESGHKYLKKVLNFPDYYGENLDALYDCLCEMDADIILMNPDEVDEDIISTFEDASKENDKLTFRLIYPKL